MNPIERFPGAHYLEGSQVDRQESPVSNYDWKHTYEKMDHLKMFAEKADHAWIAYSGLLSNFQRVPIKDPLSGKIFTSGEQLYQSLKFPPGSLGREAVMSTTTPGDALEAALKYSKANNKGGWAQCKRAVMIYVQLVKALESKTQMLDFLRASKSDFIIEDTSSRHFSDRPEKTWGDNGDGTGSNWLGWAQMRAREEVNSLDRDLDQEIVIAFYETHIEKILKAYYATY